MRKQIFFGKKKGVGEVIFINEDLFVSKVRDREVAQTELEVLRIVAKRFFAKKKLYLAVLRVRFELFSVSPGKARKAVNGEWVAGDEVWIYLDQLPWWKAWKTLIHECDHVAWWREERNFDHSLPYEKRPHEIRARKEESEFLRPNFWEEMVFCILVFAILSLLIFLAFFFL